MDYSLLVKEGINGIAAIAIALGSVWISERIKTKKAKLDLKEDFNIKNKIKPILEEIRFELDASRVIYWAFSNGDVTLQGHHLKKMSIFEEATSDDNIAHLFQLIPTKSFERCLSELYESEDDTYVSNEFEMYDDLAALYKHYDTKTVLNIKVKDSFGRWVGVVSVWFTDIKPIDESQIAFTKILSSRIGLIKK